MIQRLNDINGFYANTYLFTNDSPDGNGIRHGLLVDASCSARKLSQSLQTNNAVLDFIVITHAHFDHLMYYEELKREFPNAKVICHIAEKDCFSDSEANVSWLFGEEKIYSLPDKTLGEGDIISLDGESRAEFKIIHTPGHTEGSMCLYNEKEKLLFSGDTMFAGGCGRTDFKNGDSNKLRISLARLTQLPSDTRVYSGHGEDTIIAWESM